MITDILVAALSGGAAGFFAGRLRRPRLSLRHEHAWGMWEDCQLKDGGRDALVPGQKRDCLGCGEREVRNIVAPNRT